jgi:hypothetical protein
VSRGHTVTRREDTLTLLSNPSINTVLGQESTLTMWWSESDLDMSERERERCRERERKVRKHFYGPYFLLIFCGKDSYRKISTLLPAPLPLSLSLSLSLSLAQSLSTTLEYEDSLQSTMVKCDPIDRDAMNDWLWMIEDEQKI